MTSVLNTIGKVDLVCQGDVLLMLSNTSKGFQQKGQFQGAKWLSDRKIIT